MDPRSPLSRSRIDAEASDLAADATVADDELVEALMSLLAASGIPRQLALRYLALGDMPRRHDVDVDDLAGAFTWLLVRRLRQGPDRHRLASGTSLCGWLTQYGWQSRALAVRQTVPPRRPIISLEDLEAVDDARLADDPSSRPEMLAMPEDLSDAHTQSVVDAMRHRRGVRRLLAAAGRIADIYDLPALLPPTDPVESNRLRQDLADDARLARRSLEAMRSLLDDAPWRPVYNQVPDCALALWDDTTADERERMAILPDAVLGLHALAAVSLRPRPGERVRRRVARAVSTVVPGARPSLVTDLLDAFWDLTTDPVPENQAGINEAAAAALREAAAQHALRFRPLAEEIARASRGDMGSDADGVRRFLIQTWATTAPSSDHNRSRNQQ